VAPRRLTPMAAALLVAGSLLAPAAANAAKSVPFKVVAIDGEQTTTWSQVVSEATCQTNESGEQKISLESTARATLRIKRSAGGGTGSTAVQTSWTFSRSVSRSSTSTMCSAEAGCEVNSSFERAVSVSYKNGELSLKGELGCDQGGPPGTDVFEGHAAISRKKLSGSRRRTFDVHISKRVDQALLGGSLTTVLDAVVTLRRTRG
jgi:hypothetical protein